MILDVLHKRIFIDKISTEILKCFKMKLIVAMVICSLCFHVKGDADVKLPPELKELLDSFHVVCVDTTGVPQSKNNNIFLFR